MKLFPDVRAAVSSAFRSAVGNFVKPQEDRFSMPNELKDLIDSGVFMISEDDRLEYFKIQYMLNRDMPCFVVEYPMIGQKLDNLGSKKVDEERWKKKVRKVIIVPPTVRFAYGAELHENNHYALHPNDGPRFLQQLSRVQNDIRREGTRERLEVVVVPFDQKFYDDGDMWVMNHMIKEIMEDLEMEKVHDFLTKKAEKDKNRGNKTIAMGYASDHNRKRTKETLGFPRPNILDNEGHENFTSRCLQNVTTAIEKAGLLYQLFSGGKEYPMYNDPERNKLFSEKLGKNNKTEAVNAHQYKQKVTIRVCKEFDATKECWATFLWRTFKEKIGCKSAQKDLIKLSKNWEKVNVGAHLLDMHTDRMNDGKSKEYARTSTFGEYKLVDEFIFRNGLTPYGKHSCGETYRNMKAYRELFQDLHKLHEALPDEQKGIPSVYTDRDKETYQISGAHLNKGGYLGSTFTNTIKRFVDQDFKDQLTSKDHWIFGFAAILSKSIYKPGLFVKVMEDVMNQPSLMMPDGITDMRKVDPEYAIYHVIYDMLFKVEEDIKEGRLVLEGEPKNRMQPSHNHKMTVEEYRQGVLGIEQVVANLDSIVPRVWDNNCDTDHHYHLTVRSLCHDVKFLGGLTVQTVITVMAHLNFFPIAFMTHAEIPSSTNFQKIFNSYTDSETHFQGKPFYEESQNMNRALAVNEDLTLLESEELICQGKGVNTSDAGIDESGRPRRVADTVRPNVPFMYKDKKTGKLMARHKDHINRSFFDVEFEGIDISPFQKKWKEMAQGSEFWNNVPECDEAKGRKTFRRVRASLSYQTTKDLFPRKRNSSGRLVPNIPSLTAMQVATCEDKVNLDLHQNLFNYRKRSKPSNELKAEPTNRSDYYYYLYCPAPLVNTVCAEISYKTDPMETYACKGIQDELTELKVTESNAEKKKPRTEKKKVDPVAKLNRELAKLKVETKYQAGPRRGVRINYMEGEVNDDIANKPGEQPMVECRKDKKKQMRLKKYKMKLEKYGGAFDPSLGRKQKYQSKLEKFEDAFNPSYGKKEKEKTRRAGRKYNKKNPVTFVQVTGKKKLFTNDWVAVEFMYNDKGTLYRPPPFMELLNENVKSVVCQDEHGVTRRYFQDVKEAEQYTALAAHFDLRKELSFVPEVRNLFTIEEASMKKEEERRKELRKRRELSITKPLNRSKKELSVLKVKRKAANVDTDDLPASQTSLIYYKVVRFINSTVYGLHEKEVGMVVLFFEEGGIAFMMLDPYNNYEPCSRRLLTKPHPFGPRAMQQDDGSQNTVLSPFVAIISHTNYSPIMVKVLWEDGTISDIKFQDLLRTAPAECFDYAMDHNLFQTIGFKRLANIRPPSNDPIQKRNEYARKRLDIFEGGGDLFALRDIDFEYKNHMELGAPGCSKCRYKSGCRACLLYKCFRLSWSKMKAIEATHEESYSFM